MILLFGEKATKSKSSGRSTNVKNHPVENSGILANRGRSVVSLLAANEYDIYMFSQQAEIDYSQYGDSPVGDIAFLSDYSTALATFGEGGDCASFSAASFGGDCGCSCSCGGFASVC